MAHENWKFHHISIIVKDMDKAIRHYESMGIGPFPPLIGPKGTVPLTGKKAYGKSEDYEIDLRMAKGGVGNLEFEVVQPLAGDTPVKDFLETRGEGIQHIGFFVENFDREARKMEERGFKMTQYRETPGIKWAYFGTDKIGGVQIELMQKIEPALESRPVAKAEKASPKKPKAKKASRKNK